MMHLLHFLVSAAALVRVAQTQLSEQTPAFDLAKDGSRITISSPASDLKVIFSSPEFHESGRHTYAWDAAWTKIEVIRAGRTSQCKDGRKYRPIMGYRPVFTAGHGFSPDGKYLIIFAYSEVSQEGSDEQGTFRFLDLVNCRETVFRNDRHVATPVGGHWKPDQSHIYMIMRDGKWQETYPPTEVPQADGSHQ